MEEFLLFALQPYGGHVSPDFSWCDVSLVN